jgi:galactose mutarotase-like enzyme
MIFDQLESRSLVYQGPGSAPVTVEFAGMPHLGLWMKPGAGYLCIEPWQGHSDPAGFDGALDEKPGMVTIAPDASNSFTMTIGIG